MNEYTEEQCATLYQEGYNNGHYQGVSEGRAERDQLQKRLAEWKSGYYQDIARKDADIEELEEERDRLREVIEKMADVLKDVLLLPVAGSYPDGPCVEKWLHEDARAALKEARDAAQD